MVSFDVLSHNVLKEIAKRYNLHVQIRKYTKLTKAELVNELEKHLVLNDDGSVDFKQEQPQLFSSDYVNELKLKKLPYSELREHVKQLGHATERGKKRLNKTELLDVATHRKQPETIQKHDFRQIHEMKTEISKLEKKISKITLEYDEFDDKYFKDIEKERDDEVRKEEKQNGQPLTSRRFKYITKRVVEKYEDFKNELKMEIKNINDEINTYTQCITYLENPDHLTANEIYEVLDHSYYDSNSATTRDTVTANIPSTFNRKKNLIVQRIEELLKYLSPSDILQYFDNPRVIGAEMDLYNVKKKVQDLKNILNMSSSEFNKLDFNVAKEKYPYIHLYNTHGKRQVPLNAKEIKEKVRQIQLNSKPDAYDNDEEKELKSLYDTQKRNEVEGIGKKLKQLRGYGGFVWRGFN